MGFFKVTSTPNLLFSLETATSRCCSPRPLKIISWVSLLVLNCKVGSSSERRIMPWATLSSSPFLAGTMAMLKVGLGYSTPSRVTFRVGEHRVSPVLVAVSLGMAPMSPAPMYLTSTCFLPTSITVLPTRSVLPVRMFTSWESVEILPETTFT